jgi:PHD/YefM family antitoxin component YafN of YafNO toxin-antitoxin module
VDDKGEKVAVILPVAVYQKIIDELEELEDIRAFDEAKTSGEPLIPFEEVLERVEKLWK